MDIISLEYGLPVNTMDINYVLAAAMDTITPQFLKWMILRLVALIYFNNGLFDVVQ